MGSRENIEQEKDEGSGEIFDKVEEIYGWRGYLGEKRKFEKYERIN